MTVSPENMPLPEAMQHNYLMAHDETQMIDPDATQPSYFQHGMPVVADITAGGKSFRILDTRDSKFNAPMLLVDETFDPNGHLESGYKGLWEDEPVHVGRNHLQDRFSYELTVSGDHFTVAYFGLKLIIQNRKPTNETFLTADFDPNEGTISPQQENVRAEFTNALTGNIKYHPDFAPADDVAPYGYYKEHHIIGRDSQMIQGGVYFTTTPKSEAVVVDDLSKELQDATDGLLARVEALFFNNDSVKREDVLNLVNAYTNQLIPYSMSKSDALSAPHYADMGLVYLSDYIRARGGVCRHQCLLAAYFMEKLTQYQLLKGYAGVERNHDVDAHGAHAWAIFRSEGQDDYVVDPAQKYVGTKARARQEGRWKYNLPAEES